MSKQFCNRLTTSVAQGLLLQIILSIATLPFLIWWRLPFPLISLLANILHPPFLILFLLVASVLFFATLFGIPSTPLVSALSKITSWWQLLFHLPAPSGWLVLGWWLLIPASIFLAVLLVPRGTSFIKGVLLSIALFSFGIMSAYNKKTAWEKITILRRNTAHLLCLPHPNGTLELIDNRYISGAFNTEALMYYTVIPHILATYGAPRTWILHGFGRRCATARECTRLY